MAKANKETSNWRRRITGWGVQLGVVVVLLFSLETFLGRDAIGVQAPVIEGNTLMGRHFSLQQLRGRPAVIYFWATWCPVCELEQGMIEALADELPVITVAMQSGTPDEVREYLTQQGREYPVLNDESGGLASRYGVKAVPASFVLDSDGKVRFATRGYTTGWGMQIRIWLAGLF